jgi:hypothetical protein
VSAHPKVALQKPSCTKAEMLDRMALLLRGCPARKQQNPRVATPHAQTSPVKHMEPLQTGTLTKQKWSFTLGLSSSLSFSGKSQQHEYLYNVYVISLFIFLFLAFAVPSPPLRSSLQPTPSYFSLLRISIPSVYKPSFLLFNCTIGRSFYM